MPKYTLTTVGRNVTWMQWLRRGGCGLPNNSTAYSVLGPPSSWNVNSLTLGQIADACPATGRELARYAYTRVSQRFAMKEGESDD